MKFPLYIFATAVAFSQAPPAPPKPQLGGGLPIFGPPPGQGIFQRACASCHTAEGKEMNGRVPPAVAALNAMAPEVIFASLLTGKMKDVTTLTNREKRNVAEFLARRPVPEPAAADISKMTNACASNPALGDLDAVPSWTGWGGPTNARHQPAQAAGLRAADVPRLQLKWAFGLPGGSSVISQPAVALGRVFVGGDNGVIYSMDAKTGCAYWAYRADVSGRFAPLVAPISGSSRYAVFFVTSRGTAHALDAHDGRLLWKTEIKDGIHNVSATAAYHEGRLYVPLAGTETMSGPNPAYECCRSRGAVAALEANTGRVVWKVDSIPEPLRKIGENARGVTMWGPAGASVWNTPTIDAKRKLVYVGTGNSFGRVAADTSDSILALRMEDGKLAWHHQEFKGDSFMVGCGPKNAPDSNCPETLGPDWDFGGSSAILATVNGRDILIAAGKGGVAVALDPDAPGKVVWRAQLWEGKPPSADGLVVFGGTSDGQRVYYPMQRPGGGLKALRITDGKLDWTAKLDTDPRGQIGAASSIPGVVFTGAWDGILRAVDMAGEVVWSFDTKRDYQTVNGVLANGGSLGSPGPVIAGGMVYVSSGYVGVMAGYQGNAVLAFGAD